MDSFVLCSLIWLRIYFGCGHSWHAVCVLAWATVANDFSLNLLDVISWYFFLSFSSLVSHLVLVYAKNYIQQMISFPIQFRIHFFVRRWKKKCYFNDSGITCFPQMISNFWCQLSLTATCFQIDVRTIFFPLRLFLCTHFMDHFISAKTLTYIKKTTKQTQLNAKSNCKTKWINLFILFSFFRIGFFVSFAFFFVCCWCSFMECNYWLRQNSRL